MKVIAQFFGREWTDGEKWLMGITAAVLTAGIISGLSLMGSSSEGNTEARALWEKNWLTANESHGFLSSGGVSWTNREEFLAVLGALDLSKELELGRKRDQLVALVHSGEAHPSEPFYNLRYTPEMRGLEDEIKRGIRNRAVDHGVGVQRERR